MINFECALGTWYQFMAMKALVHNRAHWPADSANASSGVICHITWHLKLSSTIKECICIPQIIRNSLHEVRLCSRQPATRVSLSTRHKASRRAWCRRYCNWIDEWHRVLFTDESCVCLWASDSRGRSLWLPEKHHLEVHIIKHHTTPKSGIIVWKIIMFGQQTVFVPIVGNLTANRFVNQDFWL